jgi:lysozyme
VTEQRSTGRGAAWFGAVLLLSAPVVAMYEGYVPHTYADPVGIPTACYGHTGPDVTPGRWFTYEECKARLDADMAEALRYVEKCVTADLQPHQAAAFVSFTYNVGGEAFCRSTLVRKANTGDLPGACAELSRWVYAKGLKLGGLVKRRAAERALCEGRKP